MDTVNIIKNKKSFLFYNTKDIKFAGKDVEDNELWKVRVRKAAVKFDRRNSRRKIKMSGFCQGCGKVIGEAGGVCHMCRAKAGIYEF